MHSKRLLERYLKKFVFSENYSNIYFENETFVGPYLYNFFLSYAAEIFNSIHQLVVLVCNFFQAFHLFNLQILLMLSPFAWWKLIICIVINKLLFKNFTILSNNVDSYFAILQLQDNNIHVSIFLIKTLWKLERALCYNHS